MQCAMEESQWLADSLNVVDVVEELQYKVVNETTKGIPHRQNLDVLLKQLLQ
jgi:hypothetical protein